MLATAYAHTLLFLTLTVQVHVLAGRCLRNQSSLSSSSAVAADTTAEVHRRVLQRTYAYFFDTGLPHLLTTVERAVMDVWSEAAAEGEEGDALTSTGRVTRARLHEIIQTMRQALESGGGGGGVRQRRYRSMLRFILPPEAYHGPPVTTIIPESVCDGAFAVAENGGDDEDATVWKILEETWDLFESPIWRDAERDSLEFTFDVLREEYWGKVFVDNGADPSSSNSSNTVIAKPMANVIPQLKHAANSFYNPITTGSDREHASAASLSWLSYGTRLERVPTVLELADISFD